MPVSTFTLPGEIAVTVRTPASEVSAPAIILCHGFCGIQQLLLPAFADAFMQAGFTAITFDYRGFGASGGERGRLVPEQQIEDILSVVNWARTLPGVAEIGLWGTSFGGCHVLGAAARDPQIKCVVSQLAFADGEAIVTGKMSAEEKSGFIATLDKMAEKQASTGKEMFVAITRVLNDAESKAFFENHKAEFPTMDIKIPFLTVRETLQYKPQDNARKVSCPTLVMVAGADSVNPPEQGIALYDAVASQEKKLHVEDGAKHYDMYSGEHFSNIISQQIDWFKTWL
ncbi:alpha/beta hydrolase [Pantoea sp. BAV 3049]|uniref:UilS family quorum-quenching N-acyl-homoserine lactonase n=1 Tax=Pantoea sp. BAV 3049 TaxID=2654188 RepID=UPI00131B2012|nr:alpha/beta fold hydrolase [Pantoea sp. BAV 3049]